MIKKLITFSCLPFTGSTRIGIGLSRLRNITYLGEVSRLERGCSYCTQRGNDCVFWPPELDSTISDLDPITRYELLINRVHGEVVIDGSKAGEELWQRNGNNDIVYGNFAKRFALSSLLLVRNIEDWVISASLAEDSVNPQEHFLRALNHYVDTYRAILNRLHLYRVRHLVVRTEDTWTLQPGSPLFNQLTQFLDLSDFLLDTDPVPVHQVGGNNYTIGTWERDQTERDLIFQDHLKQVSALIDSHPDARQLQTSLLNA